MEKIFFRKTIIVENMQTR